MSERLSAEDSEPDSEGVVGRDACGDDSDPAKCPEAGAFLNERLSEDFILREEACRERERAQPESADEHRPGDDLPALGHAKAFDLANIKLAGEAVHDGTRTQEEQCLEERMGVDMEASSECLHHAEPHEHVSEL